MFLALVVAVAALGMASGPYWLFLSRSDLGVPRGFYKCGVSDEPGRRVRECVIGADGVILVEERFVDGTVRRSWLAHGRFECIREVIEPGGVKRVQQLCPQSQW
ncbi:hypothetical protein D7X12_21445 [Corallococcus sicarius]|uniref:Uncharacterized protein n=2 Tax=Corallococcus sicarius TaxID=2316726 RepID=A0A3A8N712_9BACT|nr:hypothetical protein D7X12_21445 [Corallococcus sicarius]